MLLALATAGCSVPPGAQTPAVTMTAHYATPAPTPLASPTPAPTAPSAWNGMYVKLYGNVSAEPGEHVYGKIIINYIDKNYWDEKPYTTYDTSVGGAYSLEVRAKVPFKVEVGYLYVGQLPGAMTVKRLDDVYVIGEDTRLDLDIATSNIAPKN